MSHVITCPSGLTGRVRGMKVREERILADRKLAKSGGQVDELLGACWEEMLDPGLYDFGDKGIDWGAVLQGDRVYALLQVHALTYGLEFAFALGYQNNGCRARSSGEPPRYAAGAVEPGGGSRRRAPAGPNRVDSRARGAPPHPRSRIRAAIQPSTSAATHATEFAPVRTGRGNAPSAMRA